jgi:hypothetical protein
MGDALCGAMFRESKRISATGERLTADSLAAIYRQAWQDAERIVRPLVDESAWSEYAGNESTERRSERRRVNGRSPGPMRPATAVMFGSMMTATTCGLVCGRSPLGVHVFDRADVVSVHDVDPDGAIFDEVAAAFAGWLQPGAVEKIAVSLERVGKVVVL